MKLKDVLSPGMEKQLSESITLGIDIGSRMGKAVLLTESDIFAAITGTDVNMQKTADHLVSKLLDKSGITMDKIKFIVGTGYGRISLNFNDIPSEIVTEISCHAMGAHYLCKSAQTIIDIGGQDSKAIRIDPENGKVIDFIMNDKCAAGSGRFLERVAELLSLSLEDSGKLALKSENRIEISSQCVVFAESEIVSLKARGENRADIIAAVNLATARRVRALVNRVGIEPDILFSGGVSNNPGMIKALEEVVGHSFVKTKLNMSYNGALGAAIFAQRYLNNREKN